MNLWITRLAAILRDLTGLEASAEDAGSARAAELESVALWWKASAGQPPATVWIGMEEAAAATLIETVLKSAVPAGEVGNEFRKLLARLDENGEGVDQGPHDVVCNAFEIRLSGLEPLRVYIAASDSDDWSNLEVLKDIELPVMLRFGTTRMTLQDLTSLSSGSVIEFDGGLNDPVEVLVNGRVIARGEAVIVQDSYAVRISEIASPPDRIAFHRDV